MAVLVKLSLTAPDDLLLLVYDFKLNVRVHLARDIGIDSDFGMLAGQRECSFRNRHAFGESGSFSITLGFFSSLLVSLCLGDSSSLLVFLSLFSSIGISLGLCGGSGLLDALLFRLFLSCLLCFLCSFSCYSCLPLFFFSVFLFFEGRLCLQFSFHCSISVSLGIGRSLLLSSLLGLKCSCFSFSFGLLCNLLSG